ncbi:MAG: S8 family serine peptidase [Bacteroidia bacterium]|nr:S8 family serine peptidase [Bacteroidia bacterium]
MVKTLSLFYLFFLCTYSFAQDTLKFKKYWVLLTDKNNSYYSINDPAQFLSPRAIERRSNQNIPIKENDLPVSKIYVDSIKGQGGQIINRSKWFNAVTIKAQDSSTLLSILNLPFVKQISPIAFSKRDPVDYQLKMSTGKTQNFADIKDEDYGLAFNQIKMLNGHLLHQAGYTGKGKLIAVMDAGFKKVDSLSAFDSIMANNQVIATYNFVTGNDSVYNSRFSHGTNVLSTMAANMPGEIIGTAPHAEYLLLISEDGESELIIEEDNWVAAIEYADSMGTDIVNSSLGYTTFDDTSMNHTYQDMDGNTTKITIAADIAASKGILVVSSAGNEATTSWKYISAPADGDSVLTVGGVNKNGKYASFSSIGPTSDGRIKPNVVAQGSASIIVNTKDTIQYGSGTSFSAPIIAGMAACLWQANPTKTNMEIFKIIEISAHQYYTPDYELGFGIPDFNLANELLMFDSKNSGNDRLINLFPNPFINTISIFGYTANAGEGLFEMFDSSGRNVSSRSINISKDINQDLVPLKNNSSPVKFNSANYFNFTLNNLENLSQGLYVVRLTINETTVVKKIIKL